MKAIVISEKGGPEVLRIREVPQPVPQDREVLIRVRAAGVNRSDVVSRNSDFYGNSGSEIPGLEISGEVVAAGPGVKRWKKGDRICALVAGGGYAEYKAVDERVCLPVPDGLTFEEAAGLPETIFTVWYNVFKTCGLQPGENFLVHGGSSGIGVTAIQMVSAYGARVYTTAGTGEKCSFCESLGATLAVNYKTTDFAALLKPVGIDVILDMTGGDNTLRNLEVMNMDGRMSFINAMNGSRAEIDIFRIMSKRLMLTGSMLKPRSDDFKAELAQEIEETVWPWIAAGRVRPVVYRVFPLAEAAEAQRLMETSAHTGKIILSVAGTLS